MESDGERLKRLCKEKKGPYKESKKTTQQEVEELNEALRSGFKQPEQRQVLQFEDISLHIYSLLTDKSKSALNSPRVLQLMSVNNKNEVQHVVRYWGVRTSTKSCGALALSKVINKVTDKYSILGVLAPPSQLELHGTAGIVSLCYLAVSANDAALIDREADSINEGEMPKVQLETPEDIQEAIDSGLNKIYKEFKEE